MSRRRDGSDLPAEIAGSVLGAIFAVVVSVIALILGIVFQSLKVSPNEKLRQLQSPSIWGKRPKPLTCPQCKHLNEFDVQVCWGCGFLLRVENKKTVTLLERVGMIAAFIGEYGTENFGLVFMMVLVGIGLGGCSLCVLLFIIDPANV